MSKQRGKGRDAQLERTWRKRLARHGSSGLTVREYCEREELPESSFYHWRREVAERDKAGMGQRSGPSGGVRLRHRPSPLFLPVDVKNGRSSVFGAVIPPSCGTATPAEGVIELRLPSGHVIRGGEAEKLAQLAALLGGSTC